MKFRKWEISLIIALMLSIPVCGIITIHEQKALSDKIIRLHIVGASDSAEDQYKKLLVRDAVTEVIGEKIGKSENIAYAVKTAESMCPELAGIAESVSGQSAVCNVTEEYFPTRNYESFSLPAGKYETLRITLGEGEGRNWWCVVYPALCFSSCSFEDSEELTEGEIRLITSDAPDVKLKFRFLEYFAKIKELTEK